MTKTVTLFFIICLLSSAVSAATLDGTIYDAGTKQPIPFTTVVVTGEGRSTISNADGQFRLKLTKGEYQLKFTNVAYYSHLETVRLDNAETKLDIYLNPAVIELPGIKVYERDYDAAQRIILEAIKRKKEILSQLQSYNFEAYTKLIVRDTSKSDSTGFLLLTETQLKAFWEYPDRYKEIITARKQSANIDAASNLVTVGEVLNFNSNRIDFGEQSFVSPTAEDALDNYNYYLLDTVYYDSKMVYLLEVEPKSSTKPLFQGTISIADSSFAVVGVDLTFNEGFDNPYIKLLDLKQEYHEFSGKYWMPTVIKYLAIVDIPLPVIPVISLDYTAVLNHFYFEPENQDTVFNDYVLEVDKEADDYDSTRWYENQLVPLTALESYGYRYIDSVENHKPLYKKLLMLIPASVYLVGYAQDFLHFNRVEGLYLGGKYKLGGVDDKFELNLKTGYSFDAEIWQSRFKTAYQLNRDLRLKFGIEYHNLIRTQNTIISEPDGNATLRSLFEKLDPYNYHREEGYALTTSLRPLKEVDLTLAFNDYDYYSLNNNNDYSFFYKDRKYEDNLPVSEGKLRSLSVDIQYDSRPLIKDKDKERKFIRYPFTLFSLQVEKADPDWIDNDFDFTVIKSSLYTERRVLGLGVGKLMLNAAQTISGKLPQQRYFTVDYIADYFGYALYFKTIDSLNFWGNRFFSVYYNHDFGTILFKKSKIPLIKDIPLSFNIHGGLFVSELEKKKSYYGGDYLHQANHPYGEIGFGFGRIYVFKTYFTWQLSDYNSRKFSFNIDLNF